MRLWFVVAVAMVLSISGCAGKKEAALEIVKVKAGWIESSIPATGTVTPRNRLEIKPPVAGRIESVLVEEGQNVKKGQILAWMSSQERATLLDAARANGEDELKRWEELYKPTPIIAPINGFIIQRNVEVGQSFGSSDTVLVMADRLIVKSQVDETDIGRIHTGQPATIILDAYSKESIKGKVEQIAYESTVVSNVTVYEVNVIPQTVPVFFRTGMSATVNFSLAEKNNALLVPSRALKKRGNNTYAFKVAKDNALPSSTQVVTGLEDKDNTEITSGLAEGDNLVIPTSTLLKQIGFTRNGNHMPISPFGNQKKS
ncbi:MAG: HlyD family efflux transporter periplasmic adaptor subunit [Candidatus Margulisiibacteriota bacterium]